MKYIHDKQGRVYKILGQNKAYTLLECQSDYSRVKIKNEDWDALGFIRP